MIVHRPLCSPLPREYRTGIYLAYPDTYGYGCSALWGCTYWYRLYTVLVSPLFGGWGVDPQNCHAFGGLSSLPLDQKNEQTFVVL